MKQTSYIKLNLTIKSKIVIMHPCNVKIMVYAV